MILSYFCTSGCYALSSNPARAGHGWSYADLNLAWILHRFFSSNPWMAHLLLCHISGGRFQLLNKFNDDSSLIINCWVCKFLIIPNKSYCIKLWRWLGINWTSVICKCQWTRFWYLCTCCNVDETVCHVILVQSQSLIVGLVWLEEKMWSSFRSSTQWFQTRHSHFLSFHRHY